MIAQQFKFSSLQINKENESSGSIQIQIILQISLSSFFQYWRRSHDDSMLEHIETKLCLDSQEVQTKGLVLNPCNSRSMTQQWKFQLSKRT